MKKIKKHHFTHIDPEGQKTIDTNQGKKGNKTKVDVKSPSDNLSFIKKDLKRTVIVITLFLGLLVAIYFVQTKTGLFAPVLKLFGL